MSGIICWCDLRIYSSLSVCVCAPAFEKNQSVCGPVFMRNAKSIYSLYNMGNINPFYQDVCAKTTPQITVCLVCGFHTETKPTGCMCLRVRKWV